MYVTKDELAKYSGVTRDEGDTLGETFIGSSEEIVEHYLGYDPETSEDFDKEKTVIVYSSDGEHFYEDAALTKAATIPEGITPEAKGTENQYSYTIIVHEIPYLIRLTVLRIASLLQLEENNNIGVNSKSFGESGSRTFLNVVDYEKYLQKISFYKKVTAV